MDKKNKRLLFLGIGIFVLLLIVIVFLVMRIRSNNANGVISITENRWIERNKNTLVDVSILNDIPVFGTDGEGLFFDFIDYISDDTGLTFNKVAYNYGSASNYDYTFKVLGMDEKLSENDLLFYEDNYVMVGKSNAEIYDLNTLDNANIGILSSDSSAITSYLGANSDISYTLYADINKIVSGMQSGNINYFIVPEIMYLDEILSNNYHVVYSFLDLSNDYVLSTNGNKTLNSIFNKMLINWKRDSFLQDYNETYLNLYYSLKDVSENDKYTFKGNSYVYGYVSNMPYEKEYNGEFSGLNSYILKEFTDFADVEIIYEEYDSLEDLISDFNSGKVDIMFNYEVMSDIKADYITTSSPYNLDLVVLKDKNNLTDIVTSLTTLNGKKVYVSNSLIEHYLKENTGADVTFVDEDKLLKKEGLIVIDKNTYNYYSSSTLANYVVSYETRVNLGYNFIINNKEGNKVFESLFSYYILKSNKNSNEELAMVYTKEQFKKIDLRIIYYILAGIIVVLFAYLLFKKKKNKVKKEDKYKYIDNLTSLKNRVYLNDNYSKWEDNSIYPQSIIVIKVNKLSHINDIHGHDEGDNVIKLAANKLINNQLSQSDIVRTDGNEFLIYMVGYDESKVITYIRKLNKELKELSHGFGVSIGYSMIEDDIKSIDDAINEAVIELKKTREMSEK